MPGTNYALRKCMTLSLILERGKMLGNFTQGSKDVNLVFRAAWMAVRYAN